MKKKLLSLMIAACLLLSFPTVLSESPVPVTEFNGEGFQFTLPEGTWYEFPGDAGTTYFYTDPNGSMEGGMIMVLIQEDSSLKGVTPTDYQLSAMYDAMQESIAGGALDATVNYADAHIAGILSRALCYRQVIDKSGIPYAVANNIAVIDAKLFVIFFVHPNLEPEQILDSVIAMGDSTVYTASGDEANPSSGSASIPTADNPIFFDPFSAKERNLNTAMWMMDENSRAFLTMLMMLNTGGYELPYPLNVMESWIGSSEDVILIAIPSQDGQNACIYMYDNLNQTACFFFQAWDEAAFEEFKAQCTDQVYQNSEDALVEFANQILSGVE